MTLPEYEALMAGKATMTAAPLQATLATRMHLRRMRRTADAAGQKAIDAALADASFVDDMTHTCLDQIGVAAQTDGALPAGWVQKLVAFLIANGPAILALIMAIFGA